MIWNSLFIVLFIFLPNLSSTSQDKPHEASTPNKRIVCYYRVEESFRPYDIDPNLCTHLIYSYVVIKENFAFVAGKKGDLKFLGQLKQRNPDLKVIVSLRPSGREFTLEGSGDHHGNSSGLAIKTRLTRKVQEFILRHDLDGVDLDWEFFRDSKEVSTKRDSLLTIVHLLRTSFSQLSSGNSVKDRLITVTTSKYPRELTDNYDFGNLHKYIDFVSVPAYNYDSEGKSVKHPSRLHGISDMENMDSLVDLVLALGLPAEKLIMGAPAHGILYKLVNTSQTIPGSPAIAWNINEAIISHSKICAVRDNSNWTMIREKDLTAPYIYFKDKWIGFDDEISLKLKTKYSILRGLGGIALWSVNDDDPQGKCGYGPFPLLQAIKSVLVLPTDHINQPYSRLTFVKPNRDNFGMGTSFVDVVEKYGNVERIVEEDESSKDESNSLPCSESGYMRHPKDCSRFYRCVRYDDSSSDSSLVKFQYGCPQGLLFDDKYEICNWPSWSPPCNGSGEIMVVTKKTFSCPSYGYFQDPDNCEYFYYCSDFGKGHFQGYEFKCPFGLGFDEEKLLCNWKWLVRGCGTSEPDANSDGSANLDAILSNFPPSFLSSASESAEIHSRGEDLAASEDDDLLARSDDSDEIKYVNGATNGHGIPAEHRQFEPELPKSRRSFARALKEHVTEFVGNVGNKVKTLFGGSDGDSIERRDAPIGPGGPFGSWLTNINPFSGAPPAVIPLKDVRPDREREPRRPSGSLPSSRDHLHMEPMVNMPIEMPKPSHSGNSRRPVEENQPGIRHRGPKKPSVQYADVGPAVDSPNPNRPRDGQRPSPQQSNKHNRETVPVPVINMKEPTIQRRPDPVGISSQNGPRQGQPPSQRNQQNRGPNQPEGPIPIPLPKEGLRGNNHHHESNQRPKQQPISRPPPNNPSGPQNHPPRANQPSNGGLQGSASNLRPQHVLQSIDHQKSDIYKGNQVPPQQRKPTPEPNGPNKQQQPLQPQNHRQRQPVPNQQQNRPNLNVKNIPGLDLIPGYEVDIKPLEVQEMLLNNQLSESAAALVNNPGLMKQASVILPGLREHVREHVRQHLQNQMKNPSQTNQQQIPSQPQVQPQSHHNQHNQPTQPQPQHQQFPHQPHQPHQPQHQQPQHHPQHQHQHQQSQPQPQHQQPQHQQPQHPQPQQQQPQHQQPHHQQPEHHQTQHQQFQQNQHNQHKQLHQSQHPQHPHHPHILDHQQQNQKPPINLPNHQTATMNVNPHTLPHQAPNKPQHVNQPTLNLNNQQNQFQGRPHPTHHQNQQSNFNHQNQIPNIQNGPNKPISNPITPKPVNADTYTQKPTDDTFYKSQGSGNYLAISGHKQSHYGVASPLASESSSIPVNRPQISNPNKIPTAAASETLPISKNGFIPIQPASSQFSPSYAEKQWANNLADSSKVVGHSGFSNVNNMQTSGSNNEYHYYSNPVDPSMEVPNFVKIVELPTSPSPLPSTTSSNIKFTTTKKPQVLVVPVPDSQPQPTNIDEFEKLASMYPNLFPQGLDFNRIITTKRPFGKPNSKDDVVYVVVDDKNKPIGGPIKPNGEGNQFYDESKISFDELLRNPELLSALATQQGFNYESLIGAGGLGQRIPPSHPAGSPFAGNQLPGNWIKHEEVKPVNEIKFVPTVSQSKPKHNNRKPTVAPLTATTAKPRSTTSTESSVNRRRTSTTTTTLPPVTQYEIKRTTKKPSKQSGTRTTVSSTTTSTTTTTTTPVPTTISSTSTSTTSPPPTTNSPPSSTTVATPVTSPSSLSNGSLTTDDNFFLGAQSIPQALYESIQAVIAQHLSQSGVTTSTTTPSPTSSTGSTTVNYDGTTIDSLRVSNSPFSHQTLNNINSNNNNNNNQPPAYHSYYYQPPGSNETVVYGQGWPSYQPSWYQYAFPPSPIYPTGLNFTNPLGSPYYPLGSPYPVPMYPPHHMNYQPQPIAGSSPSGSAPSGSYFDLQYVTPSDVTASPIFKTSEYPVPSTLSPNLHDKYGLYDGYDYHVPNIHGGYEAPIGSFSTDYMRSSTSPTTSTTTTTTSTTTTTTTTTPAPQTTQKASTETATEYITERPFDILRNKGDAPQIQVYIVQGANGPQVKTKTVHPHPHPKPQHHHQKVNDSPNVKVYVIDESKEPGQSESIQDISKTDSPYGRPIGAEELDSVHEISDNNNNYNYDNNNNNYYSFSYETKPRSTTPTYPSYQTSTVKPSSEDNGASSPSAGYNHYKDIEYEDDSSYSGDSYNTDNGHLPAAKVNSLQSLYNSNLYPGLRNFTDGSVPEAACTRPGLFQHPGDCNKFYECYWDKFINKFTLHLFECPVKLAFDSRIVGCSAPTDPTVCVQY